MTQRQQTYHLAEINIARLKAPITDPMIADFVAQLDAVNAIADNGEGFVWRLKSDEGAPSSYLNPFGDPLLVVNMSVWTSVEALHDYVYRSHHVEVYRARQNWFERMESPMALWWQPAGSIPSVEEGMRRLQLLRENGPNPHAFTFKQSFPPPVALEVPH